MLADDVWHPSFVTTFSENGTLCIKYEIHASCHTKIVSVTCVPRQYCCKIYNKGSCKLIWNWSFTPQTWFSIDNYAKDGGPEEVWLLCSFYHEPLPTWVKQTLISLVFQVIRLLNYINRLWQAIWSWLVSMSSISYQIQMSVPQKTMVKTPGPPSLA